jgi:hypothetical protein
MGLLALVTWIMTAGGGLYLLSIWLIEYDKDFHAVAATRLPPPVLAAHVSLAAGSLLLWIYYLFYDDDDIARVSAIGLSVAAGLGVVMAVRWVSVYRAKRASLRLDRLARVWPGGRVAVLDRPPPGRAVQAPEGPPERNFPLPVVIAHGAFAMATLTLVLLTAFGVGGS